MVCISSKQVFIPSILFCIILSKEVISMGIQQNMADMMRAIKRQRGKSMAEFSEELEISSSTLLAELFLELIQLWGEDG